LSHLGYSASPKNFPSTPFQSTSSFPLDIDVFCPSFHLTKERAGCFRLRRRSGAPALQKESGFICAPRHPPSRRLNLFRSLFRVKLRSSSHLNEKRPFSLSLEACESPGLVVISQMHQTTEIGGGVVFSVRSRHPIPLASYLLCSFP